MERDVDNGQVTHRRSMSRARIGPDFDSVLHAGRSGAPWALERLYQALSPAVLGYLRVQGAADPEDLTNEVFLGVLRRIASFDGDEDEFRSWIFTIAHSRLIDERRRDRSPPQVGVDGEEVREPAGGDAEQDALRAPEQPAGAGAVRAAGPRPARRPPAPPDGRPHHRGHRRGPGEVRGGGQGPAAPGPGQPPQDSRTRPRIPMTHFDGDVDEMPVPPLDDRALEALLSGAHAQSGFDWLRPLRRGPRERPRAGQRRS